MNFIASRALRGRIRCTPACAVRLIAPLIALTAVNAMAANEGETVLPVPNGGFEEGLKGWTIVPGEGMSSVSSEQAASGKYSLKIVDNDDKKGSGAASSRVPAKGAGLYELRGKVFPVSGAGLGVYVRFIDKNGAIMGESPQKGLGGKDAKWLPFSIAFAPDASVAFFEIWIHSYNAAQVTAYLDDLEFAKIDTASIKPPWEGQYKIKPSEKARLTAADVVGPDGVVYPNWTKCGVQGGIPARDKVKAIAAIEDFGAKANDDLDDSAALDKACQAAAQKGGGAIVLGEGTYYLDWPVAVRGNNVVIRGQGRDKTRLVFRYALPKSGAGFYTLKSGDRIGKGTPIHFQCRPTGLAKMTLLLDGAVVSTWKRGQHSGNTFSCSLKGSALIGKFPDAPHKLKGVGEYEDGSAQAAEIPIVLDSAFKEDRPVAPPLAAISFAGKGATGPKLKLAQDGKRGDRSLVLESVEGLAAGDAILINGPYTPRWKAVIRSQCEWGAYRLYETLIAKIEGKVVSLDQPLRIEFPVIDESYVQKVMPISGCGIEDLYLEQTENLWITTVEFDNGWNCWARGVTVKMCGRNPIYGHAAKWCEIRDCVFDDAWFKGGGGTAYGGWDQCWDCLMENTETFKLRHAPLIQWAGSGNVIRKSIFHESDGQWHSGWTNENLFEQCVISSVKGNGGYGYGLWASPPEDTAHGPNGPRNVVYNCDIRSEKAGLWMGGMNEGWLILYNRFVAATGQGVFAKTASFDHIIKSNVFALKDKAAPMVFLATPDCTGVELIGNTLYGGNGKLCGGPAKAAVDEGNQVLPFTDKPPRPQPAVASIYEWQSARRGKQDGD